jgi:hypothetical protein
MKAFISSTVFDLLDVRSVIERTLTEAGVDTLLSDSTTSRFDTTPAANSIETCLVNVRSSDAFVCILDQRYGPSLKSAGYPDISATHLEYRCAIEKGLPIHFFVRDRLEADYGVWKKNGRKEDTKLIWAIDRALLSFLDEHRQLSKDNTRQNWFSTFNAATDLSDALRVRFDRQLKPAQIVEAMRDNSFPLMSCKLNIEEISLSGITSLQLRFRCTNVGRSTAFAVRTEWQNEHQTPTDSLLAPGESVTPTLIVNLAMGGDISKDLTLSYMTAFGVTVVEVHNVGVVFQGGPRRSILSGATLKSRRFIRSAIPTVTLEDE